ncbi:porin [Novimethylophilus kurashikiensis]|uniref:Porin n=1 Tax=Novimethylophilus kurashikiensis TaxID=1825523 RepID=A0A2R5FEV9_9PROT|nr:porin [Novimethylophilus kurashikiensis]
MPFAMIYPSLIDATNNKNGAHGGNRTRDLSLTKGVLYH